MRVDVHQHIWTKPLLHALSERTAPPFVERPHGVTVLHTRAEQPYVINVETETPERRAQLVRDDGLDLALVAISSPIGIEALPRRASEPLIDAYLEGISELPEEFAAWGPLALDPVRPEDVDDLLAWGCVGMSLPAGALAGPDQLARLTDVLDRMSGLGVPLLVHPGPGPGPGHGDGWAALNQPVWWPALTSYVWQMQAAWLTFVSAGRVRHPDLVVVFSLLAGCAPLLGERLRARGGPPVEVRDPRIFYETSSYGRAAIRAMADTVGEIQLLYGSDRPVVDPLPSSRDAALQANAARLFSRPEVPA